MLQNRWRIFAVVGIILVSGFSSAAVRANPKSKSSASKPHASRTKLIRKEYAIAEWIDALPWLNDAESLKKAIVRAVKPKSWKENGGSATIKYLAEKKVLVVKQTVEGHQRIGCILKAVTTIALTKICHQEQTPLAAKPKEKEPAELKRLAAEDGKTEVKVVLWTYMAIDPREECYQADHDLAVKLAEKIRRLSEKNGEKLRIVEPDVVEQYKNRFSNWQSLAPAKVGHDFKADYVINLEIDKLSLYEPNAYQQLYRGQTQILVSVVDVQHPDDVSHKEFNDRYPNEATGGLDTYDLPTTAFRAKFFQHVAKRLAFYFVDHPKRLHMALADD